MYDKVYSYSDCKSFSAGTLVHLYTKRYDELEKLQAEVNKEKQQLEKNQIPNDGTKGEVVR